MNKHVLITGGAGYIGSFMTKYMKLKGFKPVVIDDLSNGYKEFLQTDLFFHGDICDKDLVSSILKKYNIKTVFHFAAYSSVKESIENPEKYNYNNYEKSKIFFDVCRDLNVKKIVYSSTCSIYGIPDELKVSEQSNLNPINPYGKSKLNSEIYLREVCKNSEMKAIALRYFNVVGGAIDGKLGEVNSNNGRLFKILSEVCVGIRDKMFIFGTDYDTQDGTAVRDYIHVEDLVAAHFSVLQYMDKSASFEVFNVGYGKGYSVMDIVDVFKQKSKSFNVVLAERRPGDPPILIADNNKILQNTNWKPEFADIELMVNSNLNWEKNLKNITKLS